MTVDLIIYRRYHDFSRRVSFPPVDPRRHTFHYPPPRMIVCTEHTDTCSPALLLKPFDRKNMLQEIVPGIVVRQSELMRLLPAGKISRAKQPIPYERI